jgi:Lhr-like helicase
MNQRHHSNNILLNLGIENLNEMQKKQNNDNNVLLLSPTGSGKTHFYCLY